MSMISSILFLPHGMQIIPGVEDKQLPGFERLNSRMNKLMEKIGDKVENDILLLTPHGYNLETSMTIYEHTSFTGTVFKIENDSVVYGQPLQTHSFDANSEFNQTVKTQAELVDLQLEALTHGYPDYPLQLNWGEVVPLYYIDPVHFGGYTILCYPRTRHSNFTQIVEINQKLASLLDNLDIPITLVVSGDLAHTHDDNGPYGYHNSAEKFDKLVMQWTKSQRQDEMDQLLDLQPDALSCGMAGLHLIHIIRQRQGFVLADSFYEVPTYFGMAGMLWYNQMAR